MINWLDPMLRAWGRAQFWLLYGKGGFPTRTMLGKLIEEGVVGASFSSFTASYPEVLVGENLMMANAVKTLPENPRTVVTAHYVIRMPTKQKFAHLGISKTVYYDTLSAAHLLIANALQAQELRALKRDSGQNRAIVSGTI